MRKLYVPGTRKLAGTITDDGVFEKTVQSSKHLFYKYDAWGVDERVWREDILDHAYAVKITDTDTGTIYEAPIERLTEDAIIEENVGFGPQIFFPRKLFITKHY